MMQIDLDLMRAQQDLLNMINSMLECTSYEVKDISSQLNMEVEETEKIRASLMGQMKAIEELEIVAKQLRDVLQSSMELYDKTEKELASCTHESTSWKDFIVNVLPVVPFPIPKPAPNPFWDINWIIIPGKDEAEDNKTPDSIGVSNSSSNDAEQNGDDPLLHAIGEDTYPYKEYEMDVLDDEFRFDQIGIDVKPYIGEDFTPIIGVIGILGVIIDGSKRTPQGDGDAAGNLRHAGSSTDGERDKREQSDLDMREISAEEVEGTIDVSVAEKKEDPDKMPENGSITEYVPIELSTEEGVSRIIGDGETGTAAETDGDWLSQILNNTILGDLVAFIRSFIGEDGFDFEGLLSKIMEFFSSGKGMVAAGGLLAAAGMAAGSGEESGSGAGGDNWLQNLWNQFMGGGMSASGLVADSVGGGALAFGEWTDSSTDQEENQYAESEWHNELENLESDTDHMTENEFELHTDDNLSESTDNSLNEDEISFDENIDASDFSVDDALFSGETDSLGEGSSFGGGGGSFDGGGFETPDLGSGISSDLDFSTDGTEGQLAGDVVGYTDSTPSDYDFNLHNSGAHDFDSQWNSMYGDQSMENIAGMSQNALDLSLEQQLLMGITSFASISLAGASDLLDENLKKAKKKFRDRMNGRYF